MKRLTNEKIYEKYIKKAVKNGYRISNFNKNGTLDFLLYDYDAPSMYEMVLDIRVAKAFWGKEPLNEYYCQTFNKEISIKGQKEQNRIKLLYAWQYHLQQMVILEDDDRLEYIQSHFNEGL